MIDERPRRDRGQHGAHPVLDPIRQALSIADRSGLAMTAIHLEQALDAATRESAGGRLSGID